MSSPDFLVYRNVNSIPVFLIKARLTLIIVFSILRFTFRFCSSLCTFCSSTYRKIQEPKTKTKDVVQKQVENIFQIFSSIPTSDEHRHAAKNIAALRDAIILEIENSGDVVRTRLGSSIFFNALRATKELKRLDF